MSERVRINLEKTMQLLGAVEEVHWLASGHCDGTMPVDLPIDDSGAPFMGYAQELTSAFIETVVTIERQNVSRDPSEISMLHITSEAISTFVDEFSASIWPSPLPLFTHWHSRLPPLPSSAEPGPIDLLAAGAAFYTAANTLPDTELGRAFSAAAARLLTAALS